MLEAIRSLVPDKRGWLEQISIYTAARLQAPEFLRALAELIEDGVVEWEQDRNSGRFRYRLRATTVVETPDPAPADLRRLKGQVT